MDILVKQEVCDDETSNDCDFHHPAESTPAPNVEVMVKQEELIIEDSTINMDDLEEEHEDAKYQVDRYSINFVDEEDADIDNLNECSDYEDDYMQDDDDNKELELESTSTGFLKKPIRKSVFRKIKAKGNKYRPTKVHRKIENLLKRNCIRIICPICNISLKTFGLWARHIGIYHGNFCETLKSNYDYVTLRRATCKFCKVVYNFYANHFLHYLTCHSPDKHKLFLCKVCKHKDVNMESIIKHMDDNHKKVNDLYRICPIPMCAINFAESNLMHQHFMDDHYKEFKTKFGSYFCHLCGHPKFDKESHFYDHLMILHGLCDYNWEQLHFRQVVDVDKEETQFECIRCCNIFVDTGTHTLLEHYLTHEHNIFWYCSYCHGKFSYKDSLHICKSMYKFYTMDEPDTSEKNSIVTSNTQSTATSQNKNVVVPTKNWLEFESYILHICPFCNHEFNNFQEWQLHLRERHYLNTLQGLGMSIALDDPDKFLCKTCDALVVKSNYDLHTHCFQHLPHMPYKCSKCSKTLANEESALKHFVSQCGAVDTKDSNSSSSPPTMTMPGDDEIPKIMDDENNCIEIFCTFCKNKQFSSSGEIENHFRTCHNYFEKNYIKSENKLDMVCKVCRTNLRSFSSDVYLSHYTKHIKEGPYKCLYCQRSYTRMETCVQHVRRYHVLRARRKTGYKTKPKIKIDISELKATSSNANPSSGLPENTNNLGLGTSSVKATVLNEFENFIGYACAECNESFDKQTVWSDHVKAQHSFFNESELSVVDESTGKHMCKHCNLALAVNVSHRQKHKLTHMPYRSFVCTICDVRCNTLGLLYGHLRRKHFLKGTFECPICLVNLTTAYERLEHVNKSHPRSEWPHNMCQICYRTYSSLAAHMLCHDVNRPKNICSECGVGILNLFDLKKHMENKHNMKYEPDVSATTAPENESKGNSDDNDDDDIPLILVKKMTKPTKKRKSRSKAKHIK